MVVDRRLLHFILWLLFLGAIGSLVFTMHYLVYLKWATEITIAIGIISFNLAMADNIRRYAESHGRNTVFWTTATILFSPLLALIAYFLTFPKGVKLSSSPDKWRTRVRGWRYGLLLLGVGLCITTMAYVGIVLWSPVWTAKDVIAKMESDVPRTRSFNVSADYEGFGSWLVTIENQSKKVKLIFHERTRKWHIAD